MKQIATLVLSATVLCACASPWPRMPEPASGSEIPRGSARVTVQRTNNLLYLGAPANVSLNEQQAGTLYRGEALTVDLPAGSTAVSVSSPNGPGRWTTRFPTVSGGRYQLELGVRGASYTSTLMLGYLGAALDAASNPEQGGLFQLAVRSADPPLGTVAQAPTDIPQGNPAHATSEGRREALEEARRLRREGLITDDVLRDQQRRILGQ